MDDPRFPIGKFSFDPDATTEKRAGWIRDIAAAPAGLRKAVAGLTPAQLDTRYRDGGWTVRQVVHHVADSHMNCFIRFKLALTEETPQIKPYHQDLWVTLADAQGDVGASLAIIEGLHARWTDLLLSLKPADFGKAFMHPENGPTTLDRALQIYSWHGKHHTAHITALRGRSGW
jgi:uncharacterized damage-inducible protein DinB